MPPISLANKKDKLAKENYSLTSLVFKMHQDSKSAFVDNITHCCETTPSLESIIT